MAAGSACVESISSSLNSREAVDAHFESVTVEEMAKALARVAGEETADLIRWAPDPDIQRIVSGWPTRVAPERAGKLGIETDASMDDVIKAFIEDDLEAQKAGMA